MANKKTRVPMTQRTWEWYKKEIARLEKVDKQITDRVRASYSVKPNWEAIANDPNNLHKNPKKGIYRNNK